MKLGKVPVPQLFNNTLYSVRSTVYDRPYLAGACWERSCKTFATATTTWLAELVYIRIHIVLSTKYSGLV